MKKYEKILARLEAAQDAVRIMRLAARQIGEPEYNNPALYDVDAEYCRAWDLAGEIWNAACDAEADGKRAKARELWSLLAPYDDEASSRLAAL